jgi:hypothetical protein
LRERISLTRISSSTIKILALFFVLIIGFLTL